MLTEEQKAEIELLESAYGSNLFTLVDSSSPDNLTYILNLSYFDAKIQFWLSPLPDVPIRFIIDSIYSNPILIELKLNLFRYFY